MKKLLKPMSEVSSLYDVSNDAVILFKSEQEVEKFISLYEEEGQKSREDSVQCLAHFVWSLQTLNGVVINFSTWTMNHGCPNKGENIRFFEDQESGTILAETVVDVKKGDELLNDYRDFDNMDDFWIKFCKKEGTKDVVTNLKQYVDL